MKKAFFTGLTAIILASPNLASSQDYTELDRTETLKKIRQKSPKIDDTNYQAFLGDEDFTGLVYMASSCPKDSIIHIERNMDIVYLNLIDQFHGTKAFNGDTLQLAYLDGCKFVGDSREAYFAVGDVRTIETVMFIDGEEVDRMSCGPKNEEGIGVFFRNMANYWISLNLTEPDEEYTGFYQSACDLQKVEK